MTPKQLGAHLKKQLRKSVLSFDVEKDEVCFDCKARRYLSRPAYFAR